MRRALIVMAKDPRPGLVKTRLIPRLGPGGAAGLYRTFVQDILDETASVPRAERFVYFHPDSGRAWFEAAAGERFALRVQRGPTLSERMIAAFDELFVAGFDAVVMRNSDSPTLPARLIAEALDALESGTDLALGPDRGGGYCLVGLRGPRPELFRGMPMSTPSVLEETIRRAKGLGLRVRRLEPWLDVDTPEDLDALRREIEPGSRAAGAACDRTQAFLASVVSLRQGFPSASPPVPRASP